MKNIIVSIITSVAVVLLTVFLLPNTLKINDDYTVVGGAIRNTGDGWEVISDSSHKPIAITSVETTDESVVVHYPNSNKVVSFNVTPDETMASDGYTMGASVGLDKTIIHIYDKNQQQINPNDYQNELGNIWVNGIFAQ